MQSENMLQTELYFHHKHSGHMNVRPIPSIFACALDTGMAHVLNGVE